MTDLLVIFSPEKKAAADEIARASRSAGYQVALAESAGPEDIAERARGVPAALIIWSRRWASSAIFDEWLAPLRQLPNLIEVSTDGIEPDTGEAGRVVLLSGWRGQPHHLGWQRILAELDRLAGARQKASVATPRARDGDAAAPRSAPASASSWKTNRLALPALAVLAIAAAAGAVTWQRSDPAERERVAVNRDAAARPVGHPAPSSSMPPALPQLPRMQPAEAVAARPETVPTQPMAVAAVARPTRAAHRQVRNARASAPVKRYSRRYAKTMRLFCARSGRWTPQCRTFRRSIARRNA